MVVRPMELHRVGPLCEEAKSLAEAEFSAQHDAVAFLIEPYEGSAAKDMKKTTAALPLGPGGGARYTLHMAARVGWLAAGQSTINIGRDAACEIFLPHENISKRHATIQ